MARQTNSCDIHKLDNNRRPLDHIMVNLPFSQAGDKGESGRHKCAYCAYEKGFADGMRRAGDTLRTLLLREAGYLEKRGH